MGPGPRAPPVAIIWGAIGASYGEGPGGIVMVAAAIAVSLVVGNVLGFISEKIAGGLARG